MFKIIVLSSILAVCNIAYAAVAETESTSAIALSEQFKVAHEKRDYQMITRLINWDGVRKPMRKKIEVYTSATFGLKINSVTIEEVSDGQFHKVTMGNKVVKPNLNVTHIMKVHFDVDASIPEATGKDTTVYLIGSKDDEYKIAVYVKEGGSSRYPHD